MRNFFNWIWDGAKENWIWIVAPIVVVAVLLLIGIFFVGDMIAPTDYALF